MSQTNALKIVTPEGIAFSQQLAGPVSRFTAWLIDLACILALSLLLRTVCAVFSLLSTDLAQALSLLLYFIFSVCYGMLLEWYWRGQTIGKRVLRLRVVDASGFRLQPSQVVVRNLLRSVDMLPFFYLVGGIACLLSRRAQRLGDFAASTIVVRIPKVEEPDLDQVLAGKYNSLRTFPHLEARLRQRASPAEASLALHALVRRDQLDPVARLKLFQELADHFRQLVPFPPEASDGVTDEQYLRNVVDILYRSKMRPREKSLTGA
jgi:uncharacterized RDD family membrane protein YckC